MVIFHSKDSCIGAPIKCNVSGSIESEMMIPIDFMIMIAHDSCSMTGENYLKIVTNKRNNSN